MNILNYIRAGGKKPESLVPILFSGGERHLGLESEASVNMLKYIGKNKKELEGLVY
jgi:hypothetical protein